MRPGISSPLRSSRKNRFPILSFDERAFARARLHLRPEMGRPVRVADFHSLEIRAGQSAFGACCGASCRLVLARRSLFRRFTGARCDQYRRLAQDLAPAGQDTSRIGPRCFSLPPVRRAFSILPQVFGAWIPQSPPSVAERVHMPGASDATRDRLPTLRLRAALLAQSSFSGNPVSMRLLWCPLQLQDVFDTTIGEDVQR